MAGKKFEEAMQRLETIVKELDSGELSLEDSIRAFEEGMKLVKFCSDKLEEAEQKVSILIRESGGKHSLAPFDEGGKDEE